MPAAKEEEEEVEEVFGRPPRGPFDRPFRIPIRIWALAGRARRRLVLWSQAAGFQALLEFIESAFDVVASYKSSLAHYQAPGSNESDRTQGVRPDSPMQCQRES